jgi:hypothetical protein
MENLIKLLEAAANENERLRQEATGDELERLTETDSLICDALEVLEAE